MFISKKNRIAVYSYLFKEGTIVVKKDAYAPTHSEALPIPNLEVMGLLRSFKSKGFVKETFNWQYYYYYLTNEGIEYLRQFLALPADIVPATLRKLTAAAPADSRPRRDEKKSAPGEFNPEFQKSNNDGYRK